MTSLQWKKKVNHPKIPLSGQADSSYFKVYLCDVGLLSRKSRITSVLDLNLPQNIGLFKGVLKENFVLTELINLNYSLAYWKSDNQAVLDFLIENKQEIIPIEAKANINTHAKSYKVYVQKHFLKVGLKTSLKNLSRVTDKNTTTINLPLYLLYRLKELI